MDLTPIRGIRGDSLLSPLRTEGITALQLELTQRLPDHRHEHGSHQSPNGSEEPFEDVEFVEIPEEEQEVEAEPPAVQLGMHIYFVA